jgi:flagellum-specific ATP synthase
MPDVTSKNHVDLCGTFKEWIAAYADAEDLISIGAYAKGSMPKVDIAIEKLPQIESFLKQHMDERSDYRQSLEMLERIVG